MSADAEKAESKSLPRAQSWREDGHMSALPNPERAGPWLNRSLRSGKSDGERRISYDITYMWNLKKKDTHKLIYKIESDSQTEIKLTVVPSGPGQGEGYMGSLGLIRTECDV